MHFASEAAGRAPAPPAVASPAKLLAGSSGSKLTAEVAKGLRAKFLSHYLVRYYPQSLHRLYMSCNTCGPLWMTRASFGSLDVCVLQKQTRCVEESRRPHTDKQLLNLLLLDDGSAGPSASISLSGPAKPTLRRALAIFAIALAMLGEARLLAVRRFNERFLVYVLAQHQDATLRGSQPAGIFFC